MDVVRESTPHWVPKFRRLLSDSEVSGLGADHLSILSDYSHKGTYKTASFLVFDQNASPEWPQLRGELRERIPDNRRISFKALGSTSHLNNYLDEFLSIADKLRGWCITIAVHDKIRSLVTDETSLATWTQTADLKGRWKNTRQFENVLRITHFLGLVLSQMIGSTQTLEWISDQDDIFANDARSNDVAELLRYSLSSYAPDAVARIVVGTAELDRGHRGIEDLLSIPDLAAGALGEAASHQYDSKSISSKTSRIAKWLSQEPSELRKLSIDFRYHESGLFSIDSPQAQLDDLGTTRYFKRQPGKVETRNVKLTKKESRSRSMTKIDDANKPDNADINAEAAESSDGQKLTDEEKREFVEKLQQDQIFIDKFSQEREFMENLLCQRFNFFLVSFSLFLAAAFASDTTHGRTAVLLAGLLVTILIGITIYRVHRKHHWIMQQLYHTEGHPAYLVNEAMKKIGVVNLGSVSVLVGIIIPLACVATIAVLAWLSHDGFFNASNP